VEQEIDHTFRFGISFLVPNPDDAQQTSGDCGDLGEDANVLCAFPKPSALYRISRDDGRQGCAGGVFLMNRPPQLRSEEGVLKMANAQLTVIAARRDEEFGECEKRLLAHRARTRLPNAVSEYYLDHALGQSRRGCRVHALELPYVFIYRQCCEASDADLSVAKWKC
jgi:hypothetical protein